MRYSTGQQNLCDMQYAYVGMQKEYCYASDSVQWMDAAVFFFLRVSPTNENLYVCPCGQDIPVWQVLFALQMEQF